MVISGNVIALFLLPSWALVVITATVCALSVTLAWAFVFRILKLEARRQPHPPFHVGIIAIFALFLSFTAGEAWRRSDAAYAALMREAGEISALLQTLDALGVQADQLAGADSVRRAARDYLDASLREEWSRYNATASDGAAAALDRARAGALTGLLQPGPSTLGWRLVHDRLEGVHQARSARLVVGGIYGDALRWGGLVALFFAGAVGISLVHLDRPAALWSALLLFGVAGCIALSLVAVSEHPYAGWDGTEPDRLVAIRARLG